MVSSLYDRVIDSSLSRLATAAAGSSASSASCSDEEMTTTTGYSLMGLSALLGVAVLGLITWMYLRPAVRLRGGTSKSDYDRVCSTNRADPELRLSEHEF